MKKTFCVLLAALVAVAISAAPVAAQGIQIDANGGVYVLGGDDFDGADAGFGGEVGVIYNFPSGFGLGVAGRRSTHNVDDPTGTGLLDTSFEIIGFLGVIRYEFPGQSSVTPYVEGRAGLSDVTVEVSSGGVSAESGATGFEGAGVVGLGIPVGSKVSVDLSANFSYLDLGAFELGGLSIPDTESTGSLIGFRAGFSIATN
ncbi:MAG: outer membrane beta-barrel protein [Gemmatimonadota bacterium]